MPSLDIFKDSAFQTMQLTTAINKLPYTPQRIGAMGLFADKAVRVSTIIVEERDGILALLPTKDRGAPATLHSSAKRTVRSFAIPHIPYDDRVSAEDVQGIRAFGSESELQSVAGVVNEVMQSMRQHHEVTWEHLMMGAIHGKILDADGSTVIYNLFTEFGTTEQTTNFILGTDGTNVRSKCLVVKRQIESALGATVYQHIHAFCGATWFDAFINHPNVKTAFERWQNGSFLRDDPRYKGFEFVGIVFEEYRGSVGDVNFINAAQARFFPVGVPNLFLKFNAPADFVESANTLGKPLYAKQELEKYGRGVGIHTQSNPLPLCLRPRCLVKGTTS